MAHPERPARAPFRASAMAGEALALDPGGGWLAGVAAGGSPAQAFGMLFDCPEPLAFDPEEVTDGIAVLQVQGPLEHRASWLWCSYEAIQKAAGEAFACPEVRRVVLRIVSPGGVVAGMRACHRALRAMARASGKRLVAYLDEQGTSAAYEVACAASEVWLPASGQAGSVGVLLAAVDESRRLRKEGIRVRYLTTGARKADGHPGAKATPEGLAAAQGKVDKLGGQFFRSVARARGMTPGAVQALQAGVFLGSDAVKAGLADGVASWPRFLELVRAEMASDTGSVVRATVGTTPAAQGGTRGEDMGAKLKAIAARDEAIKALDAARADAKVAKEAASKGGSAPLSAFAKALKAKESARARLLAAEAEVEKMAKPAAEDEEAEESEVSSTGSNMSDADEDSGTGSSMSTKGSEAAAGGASVSKALAAADAAFVAAMGGDPQAARLRAPSRMLRYAEKATGQRGLDAALGALSGMKGAAAKTAKLAEDVERLKASDRATRVDALLAKAHAEGKVVPTSPHGKRLRADGLAMGSGWLKGTIAVLPVSHRPLAAGPRAARNEDEGTELAGGDAQEQKMLAQARAGLSAEQLAAFDADYKGALSKRDRSAPRN